MAARVDPQLITHFHKEPGGRPQLEPADRLRPGLDLGGASGIRAGLEGNGTLVEPAGSALARAAFGAFVRASLEIRDKGSFQFAQKAIGFTELEAFFTPFNRV